MVRGLIDHSVNLQLMKFQSKILVDEIKVAGISEILKT